MVITSRFVSDFGLNDYISVLQGKSMWQNHLSLSIDIDHTFRVELPLSYSQEEIEQAADDLIEDYLNRLADEQELF